MSIRISILSKAVAMMALIGMATAPAAAQSILRDAETEALLGDLARPVVAAAGLDPRNVEIVLVNDSSVNAFVAGGQRVYVNSGLIKEADSAAQVQGVIAHELGHITGGHAVFNGGESQATGISILSLVLGAAAAATGGGEAAMGIIMAGQQASMGKYLAYTRSQEAAADAAGASYLSKAGISGRGSLEFFRKLQSLEFRHGYRPREGDQFYSTHPLTGDRIQTLRDAYEQDASWTKPDDRSLQSRFLRMKAKLGGYLDEPREVLQAYPVADTSDAARYARAYAYHRQSHLDLATAEADTLLKASPRDPYYLELKGQILLESGHAEAAIAPLRQATEISGNQPLIATLFGHALLATEDRSHLSEARTVLQNAVARDRENPFTWYQLGMIYAATGDEMRARLASAENQALVGQTEAALTNARVALGGLPAGSADWIRAQDLEMSIQSGMKSGKEKS